MVEIAMQEDWDVCVAHMECIASTLGLVIAQGAASGEFEAPDLQLASLCACTAMMRFFHPQMIAQCANKPGPSIDQMIDFVIAGLSPLATALLMARYARLAWRADRGPLPHLRLESARKNRNGRHKPERPAFLRT